MRHLLCLLLLAVLPAAALADEAVPPVRGGHTWAQHRIELLKREHPEVAWIRVEGARNANSEIVVFGSTDAIDSVLEPIVDPVTRLGATRIDGGEVVREAFATNSGHRLGTVAIGFRKSSRRDAMIAREVARELSRHILSAKNAADPWPYSAAYRDNSYAQELVDRFVMRYPDLLVMMIHATPPGHDPRDNVVIGSNIGRIGKRADDDDLRVIEKGETNLEVADTGDRFETELPLEDAAGKRIGALGLVFRLKPGADQAALHARGIVIRDSLATDIRSSAELFSRPRR